MKIFLDFGNKICTTESANFFKLNYGISHRKSCIHSFCNQFVPVVNVLKLCNNSSYLTAPWQCSDITLNSRVSIFLQLCIKSLGQLPNSYITSPRQLPKVLWQLAKITVTSLCWIMFKSFTSRLCCKAGLIKSKFRVKQLKENTETIAEIYV